MPDPVIGQLIPPDSAYPLALQPNGIGTPVTSPTQGPNEKTGQWQAPCGHSFNSFMIQAATVGGVKSALVCCPVCSYLIKIITPYDLIYTAAYTIIIA